MPRGIYKHRPLSRQHKENIGLANKGGNDTSFQKGHKINLGREHTEALKKENR